MNRLELKSALEQAIAKLFAQPKTFEFTAATRQTEWNLAHHLAVQLAAFLPSSEYDLDVAKKNYGNKRPDIIFHKRGTHKSNYLVLEIKKDGSAPELRKALRK